MSNLNDYFLTGFFTTWSGRYFNSFELLRHYKHFDHPTLQPKVVAELSFIETIAEKARLETVRVQSTANQIGIVMMPLPDYPEAFFSWSRMCLSGFEARRKKSDPLLVAFEIGYHGGSIMASMKLLSIIMNISAAVPGVPAFEQQWRHTNKSIEQALKQLKPAKQMAVLIPNGPEQLSIQFAERLVESAQELLKADIDFSNEAYLLLMASKVKQQVTDLHAKALNLTQGITE